MAFLVLFCRIKQIPFINFFQSTRLSEKNIFIDLYKYTVTYIVELTQLRDQVARLNQELLRSNKVIFFIFKANS